MKISKLVLAGVKVAALLGAIAFVVWTMPEQGPADVQDVGPDALAINH